MSPLQPLPHSFAEFRDLHRGATVVVCGCGASLAGWRPPPGVITIGVNDVGRHFTPDYLVVVNARRQFDKERYEHVERSQAKVVFTQLADLQLPSAAARVVRFELGTRAGTDWRDPARLHFSDNSPYVAVCLALHLGARRIGLIGVDFTDDHFFGRTGPHRLNARLARIDGEYTALAAACAARGVALVNLSATSRLTGLARVDTRDLMGTPARAFSARIFFVHYRFLSCGTVFETGLREAAESLGVAAEHAYWDATQLAERIARFKPDLLFVVHGRKFAQRFGAGLKAWGVRSAVWLLDEPYEVDDTAAWSTRFDTVFVNDAASLARHRNAHLLPVAYAPALHRATLGAWPHRVGFIGGGNPARERFLVGLARAGLLDYVVGGPWHDPRLRALCRAANLPAEAAATLYRETAIVLNVFRERHHFNRQGLSGTAMNPRICEALACGALVLSEPREAMCAEVPELPVFRNEAEAIALVRHFLDHPEECARVQQLCAQRLAGATYSERLRTVMDTTLTRDLDVLLPPSGESWDGGTAAEAHAPSTPPAASPHPNPPPGGEGADTKTHAGTSTVRDFDADWLDLGAVAHRGEDDDEILIDPGSQRGPARERGLASRERFDAVELAFEARLDAGACLLVKVHQAEQLDQASNSYHLLVDARRAYLARHQHVFRQFDPPQQHWIALRLVCGNGVLSLYRDQRLLHRVRDARLAGGYAFVGAQGGQVRLRHLRLTVAATKNQPLTSDTSDSGMHVLRAVRVASPRLSIVTTVYDRTACLRQCIASVQRLGFRDYEHLIVADHPEPAVLAEIAAIVDAADDPRIGLADLPRRHNNWGIAPAAAGLRQARGEYLCFLSDDNGYTPDHVEPLMRALDNDPRLGFVYSSCRYDGRLVLSHPVPRPGRIDLGQPMFRRELFELHLSDDLPFDMMAWDWHLVDTLMRRGVRWRHVDRPSFIFRLAKYPQLMAA